MSGDPPEHDHRRLEALRRRVEELTTDIGSVLHANTAILFMTQQTLDVALHALGSNPFAGPGDAPGSSGGPPTPTCPSIEEINEALDEPVAQAVRAIDKLLDAFDARADNESVLSVSDRESLQGDRALLSDVESKVHIAESRPSTLRIVACRIQAMLGALPSGRYPREAVRNLLRASQEIERRVAVASALQTRSAILQMDYTIRSFREFVTTDVRRSEKAEPLLVADLIEASHSQLIEYANSSSVELKPRDQAGGARVMGVERELVRAIANVVHNAIKYSWHRDKKHKPWVEVRIYRDGGEICVEAENWGVPISANEIAENRVFELGYRGKWSTDRGRLGTGIGLTDARDIAERHRGSIVLVSRPARSWGPDDESDDEYYRQPFITTVTVRLPEAV